MPLAFSHDLTKMARLIISDQSRVPALQQKQVWSRMPIPSTFFGVTAKQLMVLVTVGCVAAYLLNNHDNNTPESLALEAFIRAQEQVGEQVGAVLGVCLPTDGLSGINYVISSRCLTVLPTSPSAIWATSLATG